MLLTLAIAEMVRRNLIIFVHQLSDGFAGAWISRIDCARLLPHWLYGPLDEANCGTVFQLTLSGTTLQSWQGMPLRDCVANLISSPNLPTFCVLPYPPWGSVALATLPR